MIRLIYIHMKQVKPVLRWAMTAMAAICLHGAMPLLPNAVLPSAAADSDPIYTSWLNNLAVAGWDVVSFHDGKPVKGDKAHFFDYKGASWHFSSQENRNRFISNPAQYEPEYGGYCAWAIASSKLAKGDPEYWTLRDDKLYLNFNKRVRKMWERDVERYIQTANENWPDILDK